MKIAVYTPYLDTIGGGEKYMLTIAHILSEAHRVDVLLDTHLYSLGIESIKKKIEKIHDLDLTKVKFIKAPIGSDSKTIERFLFLRQYDWFFSNTDGSIPYGSAKHNILHFQVPFENTNARSWWGKIRQSSWQLAICNSKFTKEIIERSWDIKCQVIYPPVFVGDFKPLKKKSQILNVGRFKKEKKHQVLIEAYINLVKRRNLKGWSLHLVGGAMEGDWEYINMLKKKSLGYDVFFYPNISFEDIVKLYGESKIYWHSMGFEETDPKTFEHFGISTVEAMASGCVPVVIAKGGQVEIVEDGKDGYLWNDLKTLDDRTLKLINNPRLYDSLSQKALLKSQIFNTESFKQSLAKIMSEKK